jgi:hypothetical protein
MTCSVLKVDSGCIKSSVLSIANMEEAEYSAELDRLRARSVRHLHRLIQMYHPCLVHNSEDVGRIAQEFIESKGGCPSPDSLFHEYKHPIGKDELWSQIEVLHIRSAARVRHGPEGLDEFYETITPQLRALETAARGRPLCLDNPDLIFVHHRNCKGHGK